MGLSKEERRLRIRRRIRKTVSGTADAPRLSVFRSNKEIYAQIIDDTTGTTLAAASSRDEGVEAQETTNNPQLLLLGKASQKKLSQLESLLCVSTAVVICITEE